MLRLSVCVFCLLLVQAPKPPFSAPCETPGDEPMICYGSHKLCVPGRLKTLLNLRHFCKSTDVSPGNGRHWDRVTGGGRGTKQPPPQTEERRGPVSTGTRTVATGNVKPNVLARPGQEYDRGQTIDLILQSQLGNSVDKCPCVLRPGSNQCITYDSRFQASTLAEAVINFPDLSIEKQLNEESNLESDDVQFPTFGSPRIESNRKTQSCDRPGCSSCKSAMLHRLRQVDLLGQNETVEGLDEPTDAENGCNIYRFNRPPNPRAHQTFGGPSQLQQQEQTPDFINQMRREGEKFWKERNGHRNRRQKRASDNGIGQRYIISCIGKGEPETENSNILSLCALCWAWRRLPADYFPTYINELICNEKDTKCLSGWGSCAQRTRSLDVLRNFGTSSKPDWQPATISSGSCCDCQVVSNSGIHALVVA